MKITIQFKDASLPKRINITLNGWPEMKQVPNLARKELADKGINRKFTWKVNNDR